MYNLRLLDINRKRIAIIDRAVTWRYNRRPSEATEISVTLPREVVEAALPTGADMYAFLAPHQVIALSGASKEIAHEPKHERAQVAHFVEIYRGTQHVVTGRISKRDIKDDTISIQCHTEEIELERSITPAQYGRKWDFWDLADVARDMLRGWHVQRVKDQTQWAQAIDSTGVDIATEPGVVMLSKSSGRYVAEGHVTLRFAKSDVPNFAAWDRIRWASDNGAPVRTTMQYRADGGAWSEEVEGALPDEVGIVPGTVDADIIDVRINLYTEDRDTEDAEGNAVGVTPYVFAVEMIARTEGALAAGDIPPSTGVLVSGLEADGASALSVLSRACESVGWEFWVSDGELHIAQEMGQDRTNSVLLRAGTNMNVVNLSEGDELVNIVTALGPGDGINRLQTVRVHEQSLQQYGPYPGKREFPQASTLDELEAAADDWLDENAAPTPAYRVDVVYPYGEEPEFGVGDRVRVADPKNGIITTSRIMEEQRSCSESGQRVTLYLGLPPMSLAGQLRSWPSLRDTRLPRTPTAVVRPIPGGLEVIDTSAGAKEWLTEVHVSLSPAFEPDGSTLADRARAARFIIRDLEVERHYVQLIHIDQGNRSEPSDEVSAIPLPADDAPVELDTPQWASPAFTSGLEDLGQVVLTWLAAHWQAVTDAAWYQVQWRRGTSGDWQSTMTAETSIRVSPLPANVQYQFRVRAARGNSVSEWSDIETVKTPFDEDPPPTPTIKAYGALVEGLFIELVEPLPSAVPDWDGFEIHISTTGSGFTPGPSTLADKGRKTRFEIHDLDPTKTYHVKAISYDFSGNKSDPAY